MKKNMFLILLSLNFLNIDCEVFFRNGLSDQIIYFCSFSNYDFIHFMHYHKVMPQKNLILKDESFKPMLLATTDENLIGEFQLTPKVSRSKFLKENDDKFIFIENIAENHEMEDLNIFQNEGLYQAEICNGKLRIQRYVEDKNRYLAPSFVNSLKQFNDFSVSGYFKNRYEYVSTPLVDPVFENRIEEIKKLIAGGIDIETRSTSGKTPLISAANCNRIEIVELLVSKGANINAQDNEGWTALMYACANYSVEMVAKLIELGADIYVENNNVDTVLDIAIENNRRKIVNILIKKIKVDMSCNEPDIAAKAFALYHDYADFNDIEAHDYDLIVKNIERANLV